MLFRDAQFCSRRICCDSKLFRRKANAFHQKTSARGLFFVCFLCVFLNLFFVLLFCCSLFCAVLFFVFFVVFLFCCVFFVVLSLLFFSVFFFQLIDSHRDEIRTRKSIFSTKAKKRCLTKKKIFFLRFFKKAQQKAPTKDEYFMSSGSEIRFFMEENDESAVNKIGHCLHEKDAEFSSFCFQQKNRAICAEIGMTDPRICQTMYILKGLDRRRIKCLCVLVLFERVLFLERTKNWWRSLSPQR